MADKTDNKVAVPTAEAVDVTGEKQGAKCCGCCCDYRRCVIVLAVIGIVYYAVILVLVAVGVGFGATVAANAEDDDIVKATGAGVAVASGVIAGMFAVGILFYIFQLVAALKYNVCMLCTVIVFDLIGLGYNIWVASISEGTGAQVAFNIVFACLFAALFMYPTIGLIVEIKKGIMSEKTYPREAYSCCCAPNV
jgi:hypothetical protein